MLFAPNDERHVLIVGVVQSGLELGGAPAGYRKGGFVFDSSTESLETYIVSQPCRKNRDQEL